MTTPPRTPTTQYEPCGKFGCTTPHKPHVAPRCGTCGIPDHYAGDNRHDCGAPDPAPLPRLCLCHEAGFTCVYGWGHHGPHSFTPDPAPLDAVTVLDGVPHDHADNETCTACLRDGFHRGVAAERVRIRAAVEGLDSLAGWVTWDVDLHPNDERYINRAVVLALLDKP